jgi:hypothetical protein
LECTIVVKQECDIVEPVLDAVSFVQIAKYYYV